MRGWLCVLVAVLCSVSGAVAQTAEELVARNLAAKGGVEKIKAIKSLRMSGKLETSDGSFNALLSQERKAPEFLRDSLTIQGMSRIQAYDGSTGWQISPFQGRKDPELMGEDQLRGFVEEADFYGPLVDYQAKGNTIEYLGHATVDGDDAYRLKVTLKNGDFIYYFLDPDTGLEIRTETHEFIRGSVRERVENFGSYKQVAGVYFPFALEAGSVNAPAEVKITIDKIEANVEIPDSAFKMPAAPAAASPQKHPEPPAKEKGKPPAASPAPHK